MIKIVHIFGDKLFSVRYDDQEDNEFDRLMDLWADTEYVYNFLKQNKDDIPKSKSISNIANEILEDSEIIEDTLIDLAEDNESNLDSFFRPLHNNEYPIKVLSLQKGRRFHLRVYAIRIDAGIYLITGGAIKLTRTMQERAHTLQELDKMKQVKHMLTVHEIADEDSFFEFLGED